LYYQVKKIRSLKIWGCLGIDWRCCLLGARSEMFPITIIYGCEF